MRCWPSIACSPRTAWWVVPRSWARECSWAPVRPSCRSVRSAPAPRSPRARCCSTMSRRARSPSAIRRSHAYCFLPEQSVMQTSSIDGVAAPSDATVMEPEAADYGVGVDSEVVARWRERLPSLRRSPRLFTARERQYCDSFADPAPVYAGNWCAKEAVFKAMSRFGVLTLDQIEIERLVTGCPDVRLPAALAERV